MKHLRLERYLRDATKGLPPKKRVAVMRELRGNLEQHVLDRMVAGIPQTRALEEILDDFGAPQLVSRGMWGVHMKPLWTKITVGLSVLGVLSVPLFSASAADIKILPNAYINIDDIFTSLGWSNTKVEVKGDKFGIYKDGKDLLLSYYENEKYAKYSVQLKGESRYISPYNIFSMFSRYTELPVYFDPYTNKFSIGDKELNIVGQKTDLRWPMLLSMSSLDNFLEKQIGKHSTSAIIPGSGYQHYIKGNAKANHLYMLIWSGWEKSRQRADYDRRTIRLGMLKSDENGDFKFETSYKEVYFANRWESLKNMKRNQVLVVEMTGRINPSEYGKYDELIVPSNILKIPISIGHKAN